MTSSRAKRLQPIADLAGEEARTAAAALGELRERVEHERGRLRELERYRDDYARRAGGDTGLTRAGQLRDLQAFLAQLNGAIAQQEQALAGAEAELERHHQTWREKHARAQAMDKVVDHHRRDERRRDERREQQAADEHAALRPPPRST